MFSSMDPEWVQYTLFKRLHIPIQVHMCRFCVSLERKGAYILILRVSSTLPENYRDGWVLRKFELPRPRQEKQDLFFKLLCCQECQNPDAIHIFLKSIQ